MSGHEEKFQIQNTQCLFKVGQMMSCFFEWLSTQFVKSISIAAARWPFITLQPGNN